MLIIINRKILRNLKISKKMSNKDKNQENGLPIFHVNDFIPDAFV